MSSIPPIQAEAGLALPQHLQPTLARPEILPPASCDPHAMVLPGQDLAADVFESASPEPAWNCPDFHITPLPCPASDDFVPLPEVGHQFLGFHLIAELGRGSFGRVYLARQGDLANRLVAVKVSSETFAESQKLAQLQHTHIVPIYSLHQAGPLQAACMPFFGSTTLADVLQDLGRRETLPESGKGLISTLEERKSRTRATLDNQDPSSQQRSARAVRDHKGSGPVSPSGFATEPPVEFPPSLQRLEKYSYVDAILWIGSCLADGLAHAHDKGITHRDLKPANVLLTDDCQPMLLDFNLAEVVSENQPPGNVGGTVPYMSPEHLAAFAGLELPESLTHGRQALVDAQSDLYSLGVILYELLTGRSPYLRYPGSSKAKLQQMFADRLQPPPGVRVYNPAVSPAAEAILRHCLEPDKANRYQSARQLREDIEAQLANQPLKHTPEPSLVERFHKFRLRNPRLTSTSSVAVLASVLILTLLLALFEVKRGQDRLQAQRQLDGFRGELHQARLLLTPGLGDEAKTEGEEIARRALERFAVLDHEAWQEHPLIRRLPGEERERLPLEVGELLMHLANVSRGKEAWRFHEQACACISEERRPRWLWEQRARLLDREKDTEGLEVVKERARKVVLGDAHDRYLHAVERYRQGELEAVIGELLQVLAEDSQHYAARFLLGVCYLHQTGREAEAIGPFSICLDNRGDQYASWYNRGIAYYRVHLHDRAEDDANQALRFRPGLSVALVLRAAARQKQGKNKEALADLEVAAERGGLTARLLQVRAEVKAALGDGEGAKQDRQRLLEVEPADEEGLMVRGVARVYANDFKGAETDFSRIVNKINPRSFAGWCNLAHVQAEKLGKTKEAIASLSKAMKLYPQKVRPLSSRSVLHARLKNWTEALRDAREALERAPLDPGAQLTPRLLAEVQFQVAGAYARCSAQDPRHRGEAFRLLGLALRNGFGHDLLEKDPDLSELRKGDARYESLKRAVRSLHSQQSTL